MKKIQLIKICFDGTPYCGWQIQPNAPTIQQAIEKVLSKIFNKKITIYGCSRTDSGVHANEFFFHFYQEKEFSNLLQTLNAILDKSIRVLCITEKEDDFHARFCAKAKIYHYNLCLVKVQSPFKRATSLHYPQKLNIDLMEQGAKILEGKHDFRGFSNENMKGAAINMPVKTLAPIEFIRSEKALTLVYRADGFLYKMVRNMTQALLDVGAKKIKLEKLETILTSKNRLICPPPAPAHGLTLEKVLY